MTQTGSSGQIEPAVQERMREDWNRRAVDDAHYYVAFGQREQSRDEFFATGADVLRSLRGELRRLGSAETIAQARLLEIGCGPARLVRPLSALCREIHGIDVSTEMIARGRANLAGVGNATLHAGSGSDLSPFADAAFDFVYSYAVFQHIPSREVIFNYLREAVRVLKPGGVLRVQVNGLAQPAHSPNTWWGASISPAELRELAGEHGLWLLALEGVATQYLWTTMRKPTPATAVPPVSQILRITAADSSEPAVPSRGRYAAIALTVDGLPEAASLTSLEVSIGDQAGDVVYIGPPAAGGLTQVNVLLPAEVATGLTPVAVRFGERLLGQGFVRVLPPPPAAPRIVEVMDGVDVLSGRRIVSGLVKLIVDEVEDVSGLEAMVGGQPVDRIETFQTDPRIGRWEINLHVPVTVPGGAQALEVNAGARRFPVEWVEMAREGLS